MILDAGVLIAIDRGAASARAFLTAAVRNEASLHTTAPVAAQVWRNGRTQAALAMALKGMVVHPFDADDFSLVGETLREAGTSDVVDAHVAVVAARIGRDIITADTGDFTALTSCLSGTVSVRHWDE